MSNKTKKQILNIFKSNKTPISAIEVKNMLQKSGNNVNRTTVYRQLWSLKSEGILQEVSFGDAKGRFELTPLHCHHHLVCNNCGSIEDITLDDSLLLSAIQSKSDFKLERHSIEFFGKCTKCK